MRSKPLGNPELTHVILLLQQITYRQRPHKPSTMSGHLARFLLTWLSLFGLSNSLAHYFRIFDPYSPEHGCSLSLRPVPSLHLLQDNYKDMR